MYSAAANYMLLSAQTCY